MNCSRFRFLIQQKFDLDLAPQEERIVLAHLESCESCAKFYHQLQQVILAAEESALPDDMLPPNEEQLARMIMSQLPTTKASPFAFITNLFQKKEAPPPMEDSRIRRGPGGKQVAAASSGADRGSSFPHRSSNAVKDVGRGSSDTASKFKNPKEEEFSGASNRLKAMNRNVDPEAEQRELQSTTLGAKFGKAVPVAAPVESPLTLAESIRKKISEGAKPPDGEGGEEYDDESVADNGQEYDDGFGSSNEQAARQPGGAPQGLQGFNQGMMQQPMAQGANPNAMQQMGQPQGFNSAPAAPMGTPAFGAPVANPNAPVVGSWGKPGNADNSGGWQGGGASGGIPAQQQMMPPQPYLAEQPAQAAPAAQAQPAQATGWGSTFDNAAAPQAPAPQVNAQPQGGNWGAPAQTNNNNWNQAPAAQPPAVQAMQPQASPPAWGAPQPAAPAAPSPQQAFDANPAPSSNGWGQAPAPSPAIAPAALPQQTPANGGWGNAGGDSWDAGGQKGWGQTGADIPKPAAPVAVQPAEQPAAPVDSWGQPVAQAAWGQTAGSVNTTVSPAPQTAVEPQPGGWGATNPQGGWGTPTEANNWNTPKPSQVDVPASSQFQQAQAPVAAAPAPLSPQPRPPARPAWSLESEQIETGTWQAFSPSGETLGAKSTPAPAKKAEEPLSADPLSIDDRWSTPIQSRKTSEPEQPAPGPATPQPIPQQGFAPPMMPPPMPAPGGLEYPNYSPDALKEAEPAWGDPAAAAQPAPVAPQPQQSLQQSVMQKLNNTLDESAGGQAAGQQNSWELSIQEKLQAQQRALMGASMQQLAALPVPASLQEPAPVQAPAPAPAPEQSAQPSAWNAQPQATDWSANQNVVPQPAQNSSWGTPAPVPQPAEAQPSMQQSFQPAPATPQPEQKSSLFSLDDQAIDQLFNENLKLKNAAAQAPRNVTAAEQPSPMAQAPVQAPVQAPAPAPLQAPAPAAPQAWTPAPTTWAPEPPQPAPAPAPAPSQFAQPQQQPQQPQQLHPQMDWSDNNNSGQPKITGVNARPSLPNAPYAPGEDRRGQTGADQFAPPAVPQPAQQVAPTPAPVPAQGQNQPGLFNLDDNAMDQLFQSNLGVEEAARSVGANAAPPAPIPVQTPQPAMQAGATSGGWAQPNAAPTASGSGWAAPPQNAQPAAFAQPSQQPAPFAPPQMPQEQPAQNPNWGAPQQPPLPVQTPAPLQPQQAPQQQQQQQQPAAGGWGGQAAATGGGWGQQQQPAAPAPRIGASSDPNKPKTGLFSIDDSVIDSIFADNLGVREGQGPKVNVNEAVAKLTDAASSQQQPAYGEKNYDSPAPVKVEGVGRLDSRVDNTADQNSGRIASIGKFLLDQKDLEKIGNITEADLTDSSMRILTTDAASELQQLLQHIGQQRSVIGSVIIGHDGLLIANTLPPDFDAESMGQFALGIYMNTSTTVTKLGHEHIHQFVGRTPRGYIVIADFGGGLLVTISEGAETDILIPLMRSITQLVAQ